MPPSDQSPGWTETGSTSKRLARAQQRLEHALDPPSDHARQTMDARAKRLRTRISSEAPQQPTTECVFFRLGATRYAIETRWVLKVLRNLRLTLLPGLPLPWAGLASIDNQLVAVIHLEHAFEHTAHPPTTPNMALLLGAPGHVKLGVVVSQVDDIRNVPHCALRSLSPPIPNPHLQTLIHEDEVSTRMINGATLLQDETFFYAPPPHHTLKEGMGGATTER